MNFLDWCLVVLTLAYALSGYWQGFITGAFATTGLLLGGLAGIWLAPLLLGEAAPSLWVSLGALFVVLVMASLGQAVFQFAGSRIRARITWQPIRAVDAVGGAVLSVGVTVWPSMARERRSTPCGGASEEASPRRRSTSGHPTGAGAVSAVAGDTRSSATARHATRHLGGCHARSGTVRP